MQPERDEEKAKKTPAQQYYYGSAMELDFLKHIGTHTQTGTRLGREPLWRAYLAAMPLRQTWGNIDPDEVSRTVRRWLKAAD